MDSNLNIYYDKYQLISIISSFCNITPYAKLNALKYIKNLIISDKSKIDELNDLGLIYHLVQCLSLKHYAYSGIQYESACILTEICSGTTHHTRAVVEAKAVPELIRLMGSLNGNICEQSVWTLGNIVADGKEFRNHVIESGIIEPLIKLMNKLKPLSILRRVVWVVRNIFRHNPQTCPILMNNISTFVNELTFLISNKDVDIILNTLWSVAYLADYGEEKIQVLIDSGIVQKLVPFLSHEEDKVQTAALKAFANLVKGNDEQTQIVLNCNALSHFHSLLNHSNENIKQYSLWVLVNIVLGNEEHIQAVKDSGLQYLIIDHLLNSEFSIQFEVIFELFNKTKNND